MKKLAALVVLLVIGALLLSGCGGGEEGTAMVPDCHPKHQQCRETSDGYLIPFWYWLILFNNQSYGGNVYISKGYLPTVSEEESQGAPEGRIEEAQTEESTNEEAVPEEEQAEPESESDFEESYAAPEEESSEPSDSGGDDEENFGGDDESFGGGFGGED